MSNRYDSGTTTFSPEGRVYQVEYAMEAINNGGATVGLLAKDAIILASEKLVISKLLDQGKTNEKVSKVDKHLCCAMAGLTADTNTLLAMARQRAQEYKYVYGEPQPIEDLVTVICNAKHSFTQRGGLRPFGVSFLFAGWDNRHGFQLYSTDPAGNYSGWKATAIGGSSNAIQTILKTDWKEDMEVADALALVAKVFVKTLDTASPTAEKLDFAVIRKAPYVDEEGVYGITVTELTKKEIEELIQSVPKTETDTQA